TFRRGGRGGAAPPPPAAARGATGGGGAPPPRVPCRVVGCAALSGEDDVSPPGPGADRPLVAGKPRVRQRPPAVRHRVVGDAVREGIPTAATTPPEHLLAGPDDCAEAGVDPEQRGPRQLP